MSCLFRGSSLGDQVSSTILSGKLLFLPFRHLYLPHSFHVGAKVLVTRNINLTRGYQTTRTRCERREIYAVIRIGISVNASSRFWFLGHDAGLKPLIRSSPGWPVSPSPLHACITHGHVCSVCPENCGENTPFSVFIMRRRQPHILESR